MSSPVPWTDARSRIEAAAFGVPIEWPNEPFEQPTSGLWLSVQMESGFLGPVEVGGKVWQEEGTLYVEVIAQNGTGTLPSRALGKQIVDLFRQIPPPESVVYLSAGLGSGAPRGTDGNWWSLTVSVDWRYQDIGS